MNRKDSDCLKDSILKSLTRLGNGLLYQVKHGTGDGVTLLSLLTNVEQSVKDLKTAAEVLKSCEDEDELRWRWRGRYAKNE